MAIIGAQFEPREYYSKNELDCLPTCIRAMLDNFGLGNYYYKILKGLSVTKYGYDFIEVATKLTENNLLAEVGLDDRDYIPNLKKGESLSYQDLVKLKKQKRDLPDHAKKSLEEVCRFTEKYPNLIKIKKADFQVIGSWLRKGLPVCIFVDLGILTETNDDTIHAIVVYAVDNKTREISVWDPNILYRIVEKNFIIRSWKAGGGYYLVIKK